MRIAVVVVVVVIAGAAACGGEPAAKQAPPPLSVDLVALAPTQVVESSEYLGTLRSRTSAKLQPQVDGQVTSILVKPGDAVDAGQALVQIDPGRQPAALAQARASRTSREAQLQLAQKNLERVKPLVDSGALPGQELDNARAAVESARGDVQALGAAITGSWVQLGYYKVVAPTAGVVGDIPVRVGDRVTSQNVITTVTDNRVLEANISIPVERARDIRAGLGIEVVDDRSQVIGTGQIEFVSAEVNKETQSLLVKANIANSAGALRDQQIVHARVVWKTQPGLVVPALAVTHQGGQAFVFVAMQVDGKLVAKQRPVQLGDLRDNNYVVEKGLAAGDRVVASQIQKLRDGAPIAPAPHQAKTAARR